MFQWRGDGRAINTPMTLLFRQAADDPLRFDCVNPLDHDADAERTLIFNQLPFNPTGSERVSALEELFAGVARKHLDRSEQGRWLQAYPGSWTYETLTLMENADHAYLRFNQPGIAALFKLTFG